MKKIGILIIGVVFLFSAASACLAAKPDKKQVEKSLAQCEYNIKILSNALELYANEHYSDYPEAKVFYSSDFNRYISEVFGKKVADSSVFMDCGLAGKIKYIRSNRDKTYKLEVSHPEKVGMKALYYSSKDGFVKNDGTHKTAGASKGNDASAAEEKVTPEEKKILTGIITDLYNAYSNRDLEKVMQIEEEAISRSAKDMEERGKYKAIEVYYALKGTKNDVFRAEGFGMEPINTQSLIFKKKGEQIVAASPVPVIATKMVSVGTMKVRLRIAAFTFEKIEGTWRIVKMQMY
ncbi:MAG: hypothetical protein LWY06_12490 [Firmicutes bacterium]|nr:hypothetical protein [Bacillota bacterium]